MMKQSLKISGAGISGLCAAITASRGGKSVEVRDTGSSIEEKISRGINAIRNYDTEIDKLKEYRDLGFHLKELHPIMNQIFSTSSKTEIRVESEEKPIFYTTSRGNKDSIDHMLLTQALAQDVSVNWNSHYEKSDILATGPKYNHCVGYGEHFDDVNDTSTIVVYQNPKYSPYGYMCILPYSKNQATIIIGSFNPTTSSNLKKNYQYLITNFPLFKDFVKGATKRRTLTGVGNFGLPNTALNGDTLIVGERAGFLSAYRGYGIDNAIKSGYLAGKAIISGSNYDELWEESLKGALTRGILRRLAENALNLGSEKILETVIKNLPKITSLQDFRAEVKKIETAQFEQVDKSKLFHILEQWTARYPFP